MARAPADIIIPVDSNAVTSRYEPIFSAESQAIKNNLQL